MLTLLIFGVVLAVMAIVIIAIAILGAFVVFVGKAAGILMSIGFAVLGIWIVCKAAKLIYDNWHNTH